MSDLYVPVGAQAVGDVGGAVDYGADVVAGGQRLARRQRGQSRAAESGAENDRRGARKRRGRRPPHRRGVARDLSRDLGQPPAAKQEIPDCRPRTRQHAARGTHALFGGQVGFVAAHSGFPARWHSDGTPFRPKEAGSQPLGQEKIAVIPICRAAVPRKPRRNGEFPAPQGSAAPARPRSRRRADSRPAVPPAPPARSATQPGPPAERAESPFQRWRGGPARPSARRFRPCHAVPRRISGRPPRGHASSRRARRIRADRGRRRPRRRVVAFLQHSSRISPAHSGPPRIGADAPGDSRCGPGQRTARRPQLRRPARPPRWRRR